MVWVRQEVDGHGELGYDVCPCPVVSARRNPVNHGEAHEAEHHHREEFHEVMAQERHKGLCGFTFVFQYQAVAAKEKEYRYAIMSEEREQLEEQVLIRAGHQTDHPVHITLKELVFILLNHRPEPMQVVMQEYSYYSHTSKS